MKLALAHDFLNQFGGAERVILALTELYPAAPLYTSIYDASRLPEKFRQLAIHTSWMQYLPLVSRFHKYYFMFYPLAFEQLRPLGL